MKIEKITKEVDVVKFDNGQEIELTKLFKLMHQMNTYGYYDFLDNPSSLDDAIFNYILEKDKEIKGIKYVSKISRNDGINNQVLFTDDFDKRDEFFDSLCEDLKSMQSNLKETDNTSKFTQKENKNMEYLLRNISNVKELKEALEKIPEETPLTPCGSPTMAFAYDSEKQARLLR